MAKQGTEKEGGGEITEGGVRQRLRAVRKEDRTDGDFLCVAGWYRRAATTYTIIQKGSREAVLFILLAK